MVWQYVHMNPNLPGLLDACGIFGHSLPSSQGDWMAAEPTCRIKTYDKATTPQPLPDKDLNPHADISWYNISNFKKEETPCRGSTNGTLAVGRGAFWILVAKWRSRCRLCCRFQFLGHRATHSKMCIVSCHVLYRLNVNMQYMYIIYINTIP